MDKYVLVISNPFSDLQDSYFSAGSTQSKENSYAINQLNEYVKNIKTNNNITEDRVFAFPENPYKYISYLDKNISLSNANESSTLIVLGAFVGEPPLSVVNHKLVMGQRGQEPLQGKDFGKTLSFMWGVKQLSSIIFLGNNS